MNRMMVFCVGHHIRAILKKTCKFKFQMTVADNAIEHALVRYEIILILRYERPRPAQFHGVADFGGAFVLYRQVVYPRLESLDYCFGGRQFRQIAQRIGLFQHHRPIK